MGGKYNHGPRVRAHIHARIAGAPCSYEFLNRTTSMSATEFQRQTRTTHLHRIMFAISGLCVAAAGVASTIVSLAQM